MPEHLSLAQVVQIRDKGRAILIDSELPQSEKLRFLVTMCRDSKGIGLDQLPVESVQSLLRVDWARLTTSLR